MSAASDARRRPGIWSYISFSSSPRRRSITLPKHSDHQDPFEKGDRHSGASNGWASPSSDTFPNNGAYMTGGQRSRYLKYGGILVFVLFVLFLLSPGEREVVKDFAKGTV